MCPVCLCSVVVVVGSAPPSARRGSGTLIPAVGPSGVSTSPRPTSPGGGGGWTKVTVGAPPPPPTAGGKARPILSRLTTRGHARETRPAGLSLLTSPLCDVWCYVYVGGMARRPSTGGGGGVPVTVSGGGSDEGGPVSSFHLSLVGLHNTPVTLLYRSAQHTPPPIGHAASTQRGRERPSKHYASRPCVVWCGAARRAVWWLSIVWWCMASMWGTTITSCRRSDACHT